MNYIEKSFLKLKDYCKEQSFKGWDPFDGLNSRLFQGLPFKKSKLVKLFWLQLIKNLPFNLRSTFLVYKDYNPKALALFLSGYINIFRIYKLAEDKERIYDLSELLINCRSKGYEEFCWGYNFDWQSRAFFIPSYTPNVIVSTFSGNAFLDLYELTGNSKYLEIADSCANFILHRLNRAYNKKNNFCFSYSPIDNSQIINASLLASRYLARLFTFTNNIILKETAKKSIELCIEYQNNDGSWYYGLCDNQKWIDSFHTGYNLEAIYEYQKYAKDKSYKDNFNKGTEYYLNNFFTEEGVPKYYSNCLFPIDIHSAAQLVIFLCKTGLFNEYGNLIDKVLTWAIKNMQDKEGFFYYQVKKYYRIKIPYIRWSQAWMFYAFSSYLAR